jgi:hypothetical protein
MIRPNEPDSEFLQQRLEQISDGLKEGVRREVERLHKLGLPVYVWKDGAVVIEPPPAAISPNPGTLNPPEP